MSEPIKELKPRDATEEELEWFAWKVDWVLHVSLDDRVADLERRVEKLEKACQQG